MSVIGISGSPLRADSTPPSGTTSWGTEGTGTQTGQSEGTLDVTEVYDYGDGNVSTHAWGDTSQYQYSYQNQFASEGEGSGGGDGSNGDSFTSSGSWQESHYDDWSSPSQSSGGFESSGPGYAGEYNSASDMAGYDAFAMGSSMAPATAYGPGVGGPSGPPQSFDATIPAAIGIGSSSDEGDDDPAAPVENPFEDPPAWSWSQYISGVGQVFQGYVNAAVGMVTGTAPGAPALRAGIPFCSLAMRLDIHRF